MGATAPKAAAATCGTTNVALNKTATASSTENASFPASADAVDGNTGTRWSSAFSDPQWLEVDLGSSQSICQVGLNWETAYATAFQIQTSTDNVNWTTIFSTTTGTGGIQTLTVTGTGRYIRMNGTTRATQYGYSLWEFQVFTTGTTGGTCGTTNVALNKTTTASSTENAGTPAADATDGNTGTRWSLGVLRPAVARGRPRLVPEHLRGGTELGDRLRHRLPDPDLHRQRQLDDHLLHHHRHRRHPEPHRVRHRPLHPDVRHRPRHPVRLLPVGVPGLHHRDGTGGGTGACTGRSNTPNLGPNVTIYNPSMSATDINNSLNTIFNAQKLNQFGTQRNAELFMPGTYSGVEDNVGYYTSVQGLGQNPDQVSINGDVTVDSFDGTGNATQNFWRSAENMEITPSAGSDRWAVAQAGPFERVDVHGGLELYPASFGFASGGYIANSVVTGQASSVSQQQWYSKDSTFGSWSGSVWNMVFSGVNGAPAQSFPTPPMTTLATTPVSRDIPYMYVDSAGNYNVFEPSLRTNASGPSWASGSTPGTSVPMSQFFVATPSNTAAQINSALASGCNLLFTPGVYNINQTINVTNPNTVVLGIGFPTLIPTGGVNTMQVADVDGVRIDGLLFDAGTTNSNALLTVGTQGNTTSHASNPISVQDTFFRIGGDIAGKATNSLIVNANNTLVDDIWAWRADHGNSGTVGWTVNTAAHGLVVNGNNVLATGLFVEHYQNYDMQWLGNGGETIFFQNEMPYDPPNQAAWMNGTSDGYASYEVGPNVTTHQAYGLGSYCFFNVNPAVVADHAFEAPNTPGVQFHDILTVSLGDTGIIEHVINSTGAATPTNTTPSNVTSYP